jgi:2-phosphosulfolactate phosphatase
MAERVYVHELASLASPEEMAGGTVVVIDVLRAATTIVYALAAGAAAVVPCLEVEDARRLAAEFPPGGAVLGGERGGLPIDGFGLGNSPAEYSPDRVAGKTVLLTTTNGTRAMYRCRLAKRVLVGAFVNAAAVLEQLAGPGPIHLVCSGTNNQPGSDDLLLAGLLVDRLRRRGNAASRLDPQAAAARDKWASSFPAPYAAEVEPMPRTLLAAALRESAGGKRLLGLGLAADIDAAAEIDRFPIVPELDLNSFCIRSSSD